MRAGRGGVALFLVLAPALPAEEPPAFFDLLSELGVGRRAFTVGSPPDWLGHPALATLPHVLPHLERVLVSPTELARLAGNLAGAVSGEVDPAALFAAAALAPRLPGFRGAPVVLPRAVDAPGALTAALARLRDAEPSSIQAVELRRESFPVAPSAGDEELTLPESLRRPLTELLLTLEYSAAAVQRSWLATDPAIVAAAVAGRRVPRLLAAGEVFWPALELAAALPGDVDRAHAALVLLAGLERAAEALAESGWSGRWEASTPLGRVEVSGVGDDEHRCSADCLLIVDLGGDDSYRGSAAGALWPQSVAAVLDLSGDDRYDATGERAAQGAGIGGVGILLDRRGRDVYLATEEAQGFGLLGYGVLLDEGGDDDYRAATGVQGAALFGGGLLLDRDGDDRYRTEGEGQGFGGSGGCAALVDLAGNDSYRCDAEPGGERGDAHTSGRVATCNAQGAGVGRRGDLTDGHLWAGGIGSLIDRAGDDRYEAGTFAQGMGFVGGTGLLLDATGDDTYRSAYFSQGSAAHFAVGLLWDGSGADRHELFDEAGASLGYGWDFALGMLVDGGGDDFYRGRKLLLGASQLAAGGVFVELAGDDTYDSPPGALAFGRTQPHPRRGGLLDAADTSRGVALFLDCAGTDHFEQGSGPGSDPGRAEETSDSARGADLADGRCGSELGWLAGGS